MSRATPLTGSSEYIVPPGGITVDMVLASASIPVLFPPARVGERLFWDGGLLVNTPMAPVVALGAEEIVAVLVTELEAKPAFDRLGAVLERAVDSLLESSYDSDCKLLLERNRLARSGVRDYQQVKLYKPIRPGDSFHWVDFAARGQPGFRNHVVTVDEVPALVERYGAEECYASIFRFSADVLRYLAEHRVAGQPSIAGYDGRLWAPFLPLDLDAHPPTAALDDALLVARRVYDLLTRRWEAPPEAVHAYFSGAKGFHVLVDIRVFGRVAPATDLHRVFTRLRLAVLRELPGQARLLFDLAIGDAVRLLRLPNTRHAGTRLFKVALAPDELLHRTAAEIVALARAPRPLTRVAAAGLEPLEHVAPVPALVEHFQRARRALRRERGPHPYRMAPPPERAEEALCAARLAMWQGDLPPGTRNNAAIRLASAFRLAGFTNTETLALLRTWVGRQSRPLPDAEITSVVASAYARPYPYTYGCHDEMIRSFCPYAGRLFDCADYREQHPRSGRAVAT